MAKVASSNFHHALTRSHLWATPVILEFCAKRDRVWLVSASYKASRFLYVAATPDAVGRVVSSFLFGLMSDVHGSSLRNTSLVLSKSVSRRRWMELQML